MADSRATQYGRTFWELYPATRDETLNASSWSSWQYQDDVQWLDLTEPGATPARFSTAGLVSRGEFSTLNIGESPSVAVESSLSQILEANAPPRYYLSETAKRGILARAERKGRPLPGTLKAALKGSLKITDGTLATVR